MENDLFGAVQKPQGGGNHQVDLAKLSAPLEYEASKGRMFCKGCGTYMEITEAGVENLSENTKPQAEGRYFVTKSCISCHPRFEVEDPEIVQIH